MSGWYSSHRIRTDLLVVKGYLRSNLVEADKIVVDGALISNTIESKQIEVTGIVKADAVNTHILKARGLIDVKEINGIESYIYGRVNSYRISSKTLVLEITGTSRIDEVESEELVIKSIVQYDTRGRLLARKVYAIKVYSEFLNANLLVCCKCSMGDYNRISRLVYGEIIDASPTSVFSEKPLSIPDLCTVENVEELRFVVPA